MWIRMNLNNELVISAQLGQFRRPGDKKEFRGHEGLVRREVNTPRERECEYYAALGNIIWGCLGEGYLELAWCCLGKVIWCCLGEDYLAGLVPVETSLSERKSDFSRLDYGFWGLRSNLWEVTLNNCNGRRKLGGTLDVIASDCQFRRLGGVILSGIHFLGKLWRHQISNSVYDMLSENPTDKIK